MNASFSSVKDSDLFCWSPDEVNLVDMGMKLEGRESECL